METKVYCLGHVLDNYDKLRKPLSSMEREFFHGEYPYYGAQGIIDHVKEYRCEGEYMLVAEDGENLSSRTQPIAQIVDGKFWVNNHAHIVRTNKLADIRYICYTLNNSNISGYVTGSAQPKLSQANLNKIKVALPNFVVQRKIASILSTYDNLIENNTKRIKLLEQMAENLYKEWFVRFRFPGHENVEMENGLPKGWKVKRYGEIADITAGGDCPSVCLNAPIGNINIPIYSNGIVNNGLYGYTDKARIEKLCITISARGTVGFVCLHREPFVPIVRLLAVVPQKLSVYYLFHSSKYNDLEGNGTSQQQLTKPMLVKRKILVPTKDIVDRFDDFTSKIYTQIDNIQQQTTYLTHQRDLLLPRLMSGKLEVMVRQTHQPE